MASLRRGARPSPGVAAAVAERRAGGRRSLRPRGSGCGERPRRSGRAATRYSGPRKAARISAVNSLKPRDERGGRAVNGRAEAGGGGVGGAPAGEEGAGGAPSDGLCRRSGPYRQGLSGPGGGSLRRGLQAGSRGGCRDPGPAVCVSLEGKGGCAAAPGR